MFYILIVLAILFVFALLAAAQYFLSADEEKAWGYILPAVFGIMFLLSLFNIDILPMDLTPNAAGRWIFTGISAAGAGISLLMLFKGKKKLARRQLEKQKRMEMRRLELQRRQNAGAKGAASGEKAEADESLSRFLQAQERRKEQESNIDDSRRARSFSHVFSRFGAAAGRKMRQAVNWIKGLFAKKEK